MQVYKFGGTSVGSASNIRRIGSLLGSKQDKLVVVSAMSGTTNALVEVNECCKRKDIEKGELILKELKQKYLETSRFLLQNAQNKALYSEYLAGKFNWLIELLHTQNCQENEKTILAQGEIITSELIQYYLTEKGLQPVLLQALNFMRIDDNREPDFEYITTHLAIEMQRYPDSSLYLTQGFVCTNPTGKTDTLTRGGSDYTATILGNVLDADEIQIWSDIDGMHNNDPRYVQNTKTVSFLAFEEAEELAYFGAKVLHPTCILPAKVKNIPVKLKNTMNPESEGTLISSSPVSKTKGFKAVAAKDGIVAIKIQSERMLLAYGFLRKIFEIFEAHKTSVDMITTSEVSVSMTIDNSTHLDKIVAELQLLGNVEIMTNQTIICVVGNLDASETGLLNMLTTALKQIPIRMVSYGSSQSNATFLINSENKIAALQALSSKIFQ